MTAVTARGPGTKVTDPAQVIASLPPVDVLALGGLALENRPATLVRAAVRAGLRTRVLTSSPAASWDADVLLVAGLVERLRIPHVSLGEAGLAPGVRAAADAGVVFEDLDEAVLIGSLIAAAEDSPYQVLHKLGANDVLDDNPLLDTRDGHRVVAACHPDVAFLHAPLGDSAGNLAYLGSRYADLLLARASTRVYAQVDAIVPTSVVRRVGIGVPGHLVDGIVAAPFAAHPTASGGCYSADVRHLAEYVRAVRTGAAQEYLQRYCRAERPAEYAELIGHPHLRTLETEALA
ncbi:MULTISPECIES: CoA-transferase [Pseudonocardia]|uniref:Glutaconate CoA-transferase n=1 Tax=Pseudonocardia abyssalis TaxID=2792008 RepID=A0ABS6V1M0_9PSEU|nr:CoA-transferase [Pseudonocardia abyssalis]MBW0113710.1 glutaconate CoA-transferase [Pseudonocardia abyssalis]MBW0138391.1 glutaconate CoA-transferase [Pseudonocardia abyssalis]